MTDGRDFDDQVGDLFPLDGTYDPDRTIAAARSIAGLVRYLNHATPPWKSPDCLEYPSHLGSVVANLRAALCGMSQLAEQLTHHVRRFNEDPALYDDSGADPHETVADVEAALGLFAVGVTEEADVLGRVHEAVNRLGIRERPTRNDEEVPR